MRNCGKNSSMIVLYMFHTSAGDKKLRLKVKKKMKELNPLCGYLDDLTQRSHV